MRILLSIATAAALIARAATEINIIGPFALRITGKADSSVNGYAWACHAGAATEGLCYAEGDAAVSGSVYEFYYNYTYFENFNYPGSISYVFSYLDADGTAIRVPSFVYLYPNWASNVHLALIPPGTDGGTPVSLDFDTGFFYMGSLLDDSAWNATAPTAETAAHNVSNFHLCYQWTGGYWYRSVAWVSGREGTAPQNPSCEPVNLGVESLAPTTTT
ncbi:putative cell wall protein RHD3 [Rosellinia necatrix]|uniref:Putative cell wall protein RHD3 n=1 Tax=Rosellinia necatrix TaxID=77044 RepID=A0A1W2TQ28_ROSNE|nr:putative cell wall protein RHD3 [Rosellinia necatrix]